jgi:hypothetical protein
MPRSSPSILFKDGSEIIADMSGKLMSGKFSGGV